MSSEVLHLVDTARPHPLVRLSGVLDATTATTVRNVLLDVLAGQPSAVVVDVGGLTVDDPDSAEVLGEVFRATADWPAARLTLCDPAGATLWRTSGWRIETDCDHALAMHEPGDDDRVSLELEPQVSAARRSREVITEACRRWHREDLAGAACIVATELVNNVVAHARTPMIVLVATTSEGLSVAVRDHSEVPPSYTGAPVAPTSYGGRGMLLVDSVSSRWGSLPLANGKVVWALLSDPRG
ncbi:ATP-binding protein [Actinoplanes sp. CA-030573]|uniref:ATP-binding protein n=1 Tax=Actinoplanes sp. CA-030573 TaxID=3239898 RepID=UPI003D93C85B